MIRSTIPARQPQSDRVQNGLGDHDREQEPGQVAQSPPLRVSRHRVVKAGGHGQKHHHDQKQQAPQVVPELAHPDQETCRRRQEQRVTGQADRKRPGSRGRAARAERDASPMKTRSALRM